jgi:hypothetical protein
MTTFQPNIPGVYHGVTATVYRDAPGVANSTLNHMHPPSRCKHHLTAPKEKPTIDMLMGTLIHDAILKQPSQAVALVPEKYPAKDGSMKPWTFGADYCAEWRDAQESSGRVVLKRAELDEINGCIRSILSVPECGAIFASGHPEVSVFTQRSGTLTKARIDWVPQGVNFLVDLKKVSEGMADPIRFTRLAVDRGYHRQAWSYLSAWNAETGENREHMAFIVVEDTPPHPVSIVFLDPETMDAGRADYESRLDGFIECSTSGVWPHYGTGFQFPVTPRFLLTR